MIHFKRSRLIVSAILGAYLATGVLSTRSLLGQELFSKLDQSLSGQDQRSIALDDRPFWTSHKHLISPENFFDDHNLNLAEPWNGAVSSEKFAEIPPMYLPVDSPYFSATALRAPPRL